MYAYYAADSAADIKQVCTKLRQAFDLSEFHFDVEDNWKYGYADNDQIGFNVTKANNNSTIEKWIDSTPEGVNYQIIFMGSKGRQEPEGLGELLSRILDAQAVRFHERSDEELEEIEKSLPDEPFIMIA